MTFRPELSALVRDGIHVRVDEKARARGLMVAFVDRRGGVSGPPYDTLNLAARVGDESGPVQENRRRVAAACGFDIDRLALARQVHGTDVLEVAPGDAGVVGEADVLVTRTAGTVLGVLAADCAPAIVWGDEGLAVVHAGWRGLVAGAVAAGAEAVGTARAAWVGPCIHACCYRVGPEVVDAFRSKGLPTAGDDRVDIGRATVVALRRAGIEKIAASEECTGCDTSFFSHRRDGPTGRQGAFAALLDES